MADSDLGQLLTVRVIDPLGLWLHPLGTILKFTYVDWDSGVTESAAVNYGSTEIIGRAEGYRHWIATDNAQISITFRFQVQNEGREAILDEVVRPARFLSQLKYPLYSQSSGLSVAPPHVILRIGDLLTARCLLTGGDIQWRTETLDPATLLPMAATFPAVFTVVRAQQDDLSYKLEMVDSGIWR